VHFKARRGREWSELSCEIAQAVASVRDAGYCWASWQPQVVARVSAALALQRRAH
jgi:hypothetical protein